MVNKNGIMRVPSSWFIFCNFYCMSRTALLVVSSAMICILYSCEEFFVSKFSGEICDPSIISGLPSLKHLDMSKLQPFLTNWHSFLYLVTTSSSCLFSSYASRFLITCLTILVCKIFVMFIFSAS